MKKLRMIVSVILGLLVLAGLFLTARNIWANQQVKRAWMEAIPGAPALATTERVEIIPLYEEAGTRDELITGHGVSYLVRTDTSTVLVDLGNNPDELDIAPFLKNMETLGISGEDLDAVVITHLHPDHVGGGKAWWNNTLAMQGAPEAWAELPIYVPARTTHPGATISREPTRFTPDVVSTGALPYVEVFPLALFAPDGVEQALVIHVAGEGLVLVTGCGHPALRHMVIRAQTLYQEPVVGVVGGLHYGNADAEALTGPIEFVQSRPIQMLALSPHDSGPEALSAFESAFPDRYDTLRVGETVQFPTKP